MGENAFQRYRLGKMLLNLKQMTGRLIRGESDRGLVVIVDARTQQRYFEQIGSAMPGGVEEEMHNPLAATRINGYGAVYVPFVELAIGLLLVTSTGRAKEWPLPFC